MSEPTCNQSTAPCCCRVLWKRKFSIVILSAVAALIAALLSMARSSSYQSATAQLLIVDKLPLEDTVGILEEDLGRGGRALTPVTYRQLLLGDPLLDDISNQISPRLSMDELRRALQVDIVLESDTAYRRAYSPVITVRANAGDAEKAGEILDIWLKNFIKRYGSLKSGRPSQGLAGTDIRVIADAIVPVHTPSHPIKTAAMAGIVALILLGLLFVVADYFSSARPTAL